ncbi:uncharacterized protein LOC119520331 isoform X2 [Choloepus didactylus]|uniref:uncharacterized protein LOC119520331 isoform X2 n=1 Tax=Choloepus didactylus TaxID=27675 RepID=UPI00189CEE87|nr:uncharacterized protein LOC119520331 isoform X2 [Choloepus didactylus]
MEGTPSHSPGARGDRRTASEPPPKAWVWILAAHGQRVTLAWGLSAHRDLGADTEAGLGSRPGPGTEGRRGRCRQTDGRRGPGRLGRETAACRGKGCLPPHWPPRGGWTGSMSSTDALHRRGGQGGTHRKSQIKKAPTDPTPKGVNLPGNAEYDSRR